MSNFGDSLLAHLESIGLTRYRVEKISNGVISQSLLSHVVSGRANPTDELLEKLLAVPELGLTLEQLRAWKAADEYPELFAKPDGVKYLGDSAAATAHMVGYVTGGPLEYVDGVDNPPIVEVIPEGLQVMEVVGDSMAPTIRNGVKVLAQRVRPNKFKDGDVFIVETTDHEATCKRAKKDGKNWLLVPDNPDHPTRSITMDQVRRVFEVVTVIQKP